MKENQYKILSYILVGVIVLGIIGLQFLNKPKNSLELYQHVTFAEDFEEAKKIVLAGYEEKFTVEEYDEIKSKTSPISIRQFTLFEHGKRSVLIETTPGTDKLKILRVEILPDEINEFFRELD